LIASPWPPPGSRRFPLAHRGGRGGQGVRERSATSSDHPDFVSAGMDAKQLLAMHIDTVGGVYVQYACSVIAA
jgi:hypothetical protein